MCVLGWCVKRREFVAGGVSAVCIGLVGASRADEFGDVMPADDVDRPARFEASAPDTDDPSDASSAGASSAGASSPGASSSAGSAERPTLEVLSTASGTTDVHLFLQRVRDGEVIADRVREFDYGERAHLSGLCARGETYEFTLGVDGATLVRETVTPGEVVIFELLDETTVSVVA
jgi:hypothetical protein